jgi:hypothetical protein
MVSKAKEEWISLGYRENPRCYAPSGAKGRDRARAGECTYGCATCRGEVNICDLCGLPYCRYHYPKHLR